MNAGLFSIRRAEEADVPALLGVFNTARAEAGCFAGGNATLEGFAALVEGEEIHVAVSDGSVAGFVSVWRPDQFVHHLYVLPQYQGHGAGHALLRQCEEVYGLPLSLKCATGNARAQHFYRSHGWTLMGESGVAEDGPWERLWLPPRASNE
jgi:ribosomal protein S18 acetylase RimI-like enzyme